MNNTPAEAYEELIRRVKEISLLESTASILHWDQRTYMPPKGSAHRAEQFALLAGMVHEKSTSPVLGELLAAVEGSDLVSEQGSVPAVNVREIRRTYDRDIRVPQALVEELARVTSQSRDVWVEARQRSDFFRFRPWLERVVELKRQEADALGYATVRYDALLEDYEPGETAAHLSELFAGLREELVPLVQAVQASGRCPDVSILRREYPIERQEIFGREAAAAMGFDFEAGRLDTTEHPFCCGVGPGDTRLTTRYARHDFGDGFFSIVHEAGHGIYDQGLDPAHYGTPMGEPISLAIHESQSRLWENLVGRSRAFWEYFFPRARRCFPEALENADADAFYAAINLCRPSLIRVDADEVTYNLHILVRFELEQGLLTGDLPAADLPEAWNAAFGRYLGLTPPNDAQGCLQDTHWSEGAIGYFPTYALGNLYSAQFFEQARIDLGDLEPRFARGDFNPLKAWLNANVHRHGQRYRAADLVRTVTGKPLSHRSFITYLRTKYASLYGI